MVETSRSTLERHYTVYITGAPVILHTTKTALLGDVPKFLVLSVIVILAILYLSFRSLRSLGLPLIVVGLGTLWAMGTMHLLGFELTVVSIMVPPLVLTLGSAYSIHILNQYYREARVKGEDKAWIAQSVGHINQTILLAALTTIIGFSSLASANLSQIKEFRLATSIGVVYCALLTLFFFPAILRLLPVLPHPAAQADESEADREVRHPAKAGRRSCSPLCPWWPGYWCCVFPTFSRSSTSGSWYPWLWSPRLWVR